jgi:lysozyme
MKTNAAGLKIIKTSEGVRLKAYKPTPDDVWTIGWGHTKDVTEGMACTRTQAEQWLKEDITKAEDAVCRLLGVTHATPNEFSAMVSLCYNIGAGHFKASSVLARHKEGKRHEAAEAFLLWDKQDGKVLRGLVIRRAREKALYQTP